MPHIKIDDPDKIEICAAPGQDHALLVSRKTDVDLTVTMQILRSMRASSLLAISWSPEDDANLEQRGFVHLDGLKIYLKQV